MTSLLVAFIRLYQITLSRFLGGHCRFNPTCSVYAVDAIRKYGAWRGTRKAVGRICRCHPWGGGGYDPA